MRAVRYAILFGAIFASNASLAGTSAISLKVTALDPVVASGAKIMIRLTITNKSKHSITYNNTSSFCDYPLKVATSSGAPAPETPFKKELGECNNDPLRLLGRNIPVALKPGESASEEMEITEYYDMSAPGKYIVQAERIFPGIGHFLSNVVSIGVTAKGN